MPAFRDIGEPLKLTHDSCFRNQVDFEGDPCPELSPKYQAKREKTATKFWFRTVKKRISWILFRSFTILRLMDKQYRISSFYRERLILI